ncbi:hypothetical protein PGTUg99_004586 [Puccinia graminis f. sp. tritici]|uniref:Uncharacterized protein n=1 Tax=Puccinia graminis f. sp. tritici TaxID=56615 RepID=A0A5B0RAA5_PUCGR|nr:hypothetical protein PGTUg99_004586 [Puccinia graminis f. sp. tritici]
MAANHEPEDEIVVLFEQRSTQKKKKSAMRAPLVRLVSPEISLVSSRGTQEIQQLTDVKPVKQLAITVAIKTWPYIFRLSPLPPLQDRELEPGGQIPTRSLQSLPGFLHKSIQPSQLIEVAVESL